jgi:hypothetical protein
MKRTFARLGGVQNVLVLISLLLSACTQTPPALPPDVPPAPMTPVPSSTPRAPLPATVEPPQRPSSMPIPIPAPPAEADPSPPTPGEPASPLAVPPPAANLEPPAAPLHVFGAAPITVLATAKKSEAVLFAGTPRGLYESKDGGETWSFTDGPFAKSYVSSVLLDDSRSEIYVATGSDGVFKSTDGGKTWTEINLGLQNRSVIALFFGTDGHGRRMLYAGTLEGVFRSMDGGANWISGGSGLPKLTIAAFGSAPGAIYAGAQTGRLFRTTNGGTSWLEEERVPWIGPVRTIVGAWSSVFVGTETGLFVRSTARQETRWASASDGLSSLDVTLFAYGPDTRLYAVVPDGLFRSDDSGEFWTPITDVVPSALAVGAPPSYVLYAAVQRFIWKSGDAGKTWKKIPLKEPRLSRVTGNGPLHLLTPTN